MSTIYYHGPLPHVAAALAKNLGVPVASGWPVAPAPGDIVFLSVRTDAECARVLPGANAFTACRVLKLADRVRVFLLVEADDPYAAEIARFCLADGVVTSGGSGELGDLEIVQACLRAPGNRAPVADLLAAVDRELGIEDWRSNSLVQRVLATNQADSLIDQLSDPVTGLFSAPFASMKLEEDFKRAMRFHQPLSLVLLEVAPELVVGGRAEIVLAEIAAVLLNECRDIDVLSRFTESVFLLLLPGTGAGGAETLVRRLLNELDRRGIAASAGVAMVPAPGIRHRRDFLARAEACLRLASAGQGSGRLWMAVPPGGAGSAG